MRRTKIVCTIGPVTCSYENLLRLAEAGMNVVRLNMSHGDHEWHRNVIRAVRTINEKGPHSLAIMLDTKGPEIRSGDLKHTVELKKGDPFTFTVRRQAEYEEGSTEISEDEFIKDVSAGDVLLIDSGMMSFTVKEVTDTDIICETLEGGELASRRHINIKGKSATLPSITDKDWLDIDFGIEEGVDYIALSFVNNAETVSELQEYLEKKEASIDVIAKIESIDGIKNLESILDIVDGAMVARGDLGAELPLEEVPLAQERMVMGCRKRGKPVIVATNMLESMIVHPTPTRAEVTDITQAVMQGADATMLSGETAAGKYPFKAIDVMSTVAGHIEQSIEKWIDKDIVTPTNDSRYELVHSASKIGNNIGAAAILVFTRRGSMAALLSRCRPQCPIFAFTNMSTVRRKLNMFWGVFSFRIPFSQDPEKTIQRAISLLKEREHLAEKSTIVIVSDILAGHDLVQTIQVREIS